MSELIKVIAQGIGYILGALILGATFGAFFGAFFGCFKLVVGWIV